MRHGKESKLADHLRQLPLPIVVFIVIVTLFFGFQFWLAFDVARNESRVDGTVTGVSARGTISYRYRVDGHPYSGHSTGETDRVYPVGSAVEVRYSRKHPQRSTLVDPLLFPKQFTCAAAIVGAGVLLIYFGRRWTERAA